LTSTILVEVLPAASFERMVTLHGSVVIRRASFLKSVDRDRSVESKVERQVEEE
jgi:hypothetical protein